jgi:hypothetical protein
MVHKRRVDFGKEVGEKRIIAILRPQEINGLSGMNGDIGVTTWAENSPNFEEPSLSQFGYMRED